MSLTRGCLVLIGFSADDRDETFTFVALGDIPPGSAITFHCRAWRGFGFDKEGASLVLSCAEGIPAGAVVSVADLRAPRPQITAEVDGIAASLAGVWDLKAGGAIYVVAGDSLARPADTPLFLGALALANGSSSNPLAGTGLVAGDSAVILPVGPRFDRTGDVGCIGPGALGPYPDPQAARQAFTRPESWIKDGGPDDGTAGRTSAESRALTDPHSPLLGRFRLAICFMPGTLIRTPHGEVPVEELEIGDRVLTHDGGVAPVKWIGRQTVSTFFADPMRVLPVRVRAGALAENVPSRDLLVSADHALLVGGVLVNAGALVNGTSIVRETDVPGRFTYYHVELHDHALVLAENTPAETFVDNVGRMAFDNWAEYDALYPDAAAVAEMSYPRAKAARQVPQAVKECVARLATVARQAA